MLGRGFKEIELDLRRRLLGKELVHPTGEKSGGGRLFHVAQDCEGALALDHWTGLQRFFQRGDRLGRFPFRQHTTAFGAERRLLVVQRELYCLVETFVLESVQGSKSLDRGRWALLSPPSRTRQGRL